MSYIKESLSNGERIEHVFNLHWSSFIKLGIYILLAIPTFGITALLAVYEWLKLKNIEYAVTNKRIVFKKGIIGRNTEEMKNTAVETIELDQGVWGRILGYGSIEVTGRGNSIVLYKNIDDPVAVKRKIEGVTLKLNTSQTQ